MIKIVENSKTASTAATQDHLCGARHAETMLQIVNDGVEAWSTTHPELRSICTVVEPDRNRVRTVAPEASTIPVVQKGGIPLTEAWVITTVCTEHTTVVSSCLHLGCERFIAVRRLESTTMMSGMSLAQMASASTASPASVTVISGPLRIRFATFLMTLESSTIMQRFIVHPFHAHRLALRAD